MLSTFIDWLLDLLDNWHRDSQRMRRMNKYGEWGVECLIQISVNFNCFHSLASLNILCSSTQQKDLLLFLFEKGIPEKKMELDLQNPLTSYEDLQYDGVPYLFANESDHMPCLLSFESSDLRFPIRRSAFSLISHVNSTFKKQKLKKQKVFLCSFLHFFSFFLLSSELPLISCFYVSFLQAKFSYNLDPFLVYLSVNYVDRFLSKQEILVNLMLRSKITY